MSSSSCERESTDNSASETAPAPERPPSEEIDPPEFPYRPTLFNEVEWGPFSSADDIQLAYKLWSLPNARLGELNDNLGQHPYPAPNTETERAHRGYSCLAHNVYEHLLRKHDLPSSQEQETGDDPNQLGWSKDAQMKWSNDGNTLEGWSYEDIFGPEDNEPTEHGLEDVVIDGYSVLGRGKDEKNHIYWKVNRLRDELKERGLSAQGGVFELQKRLVEDEREKRRGADPIKIGLLPREDLSQWGIPRKDDYMLKLTSRSRLRPLDMYTWAILLCPYNPTYWISRAYLHYQMGHYDLAIGDAYRAQLLCEILVNPEDRNIQPGIYVRVWNAVEQHVLQTPSRPRKIAPEVQLMR